MEEENKDKVNSSPYMIPGAIIVAGVIIAGALMYSNSPRFQGPAAVIPGAPSGNTGVNQPVANAEGLADDDPSLGNPEAPVTVVEFSDFQCPFCRRLYIQTLPQLKEKYIKTGKARFVYRDFPLTSIHGMAQKYAEAGECADEQGKFWQMHDMIFEKQEARGNGTISDFNIGDLKAWAREIGLDGTAFDNCFDSGKYADEVQKDLNDGQTAGVTGTPGTFVNGRLVQGAVPYAQFEAIIEEELKKVQ